jgi:hypothetical protein
LWCDVDQTLPTIEASYSFNLGPVGLFIGGLYSTFDQEFVFNNAVTDISIDSWAFGLGGRSAFGPFYVNATFQYGNNVGNLNMPTTLIPARLVIDGGTLAEEDAKYMAAQGVVGFKLTDSLAFEGGVVWQKGEVDVPSSVGPLNSRPWFTMCRLSGARQRTSSSFPSSALSTTASSRLQASPTSISARSRGSASNGRSTSNLDLERLSFVTDPGRTTPRVLFCAMKSAGRFHVTPLRGFSPGK